MRLIERKLKRKDHRHVIDDLTVCFDSSLPPGPDLGADIEQDLDSQCLCSFRQTKVEFLVIHTDQKIRALIPSKIPHEIQGAANLTVVSCNLGQADHPDPTGVKSNVDAGRLHRRTAHADPTHPWNDRLELTEKARRMLIPRGFPGGQHH